VSRSIAGPLRRWDPERIGPYAIIGRLGAGAMGQVYLARSRAGRLVAVKTIRIELAEEPGFRARFAREVAAARQVSGVFTAAVVAADPEADLPWVATAYVPAPSLSTLVRDCGALPVPAVRWLAAGCAEALESIHAAGLLHRDVKPSNVLVAPDGPRVIDFGVARAAERVQLTVTRGAAGTPAYMAPEQARDATRTSPASDVFSLGATLVFAATGHSPYRGETVMDILVRLATEPPDLTGLPDELTGLVSACLERVPRDRPTTTAILAGLGSFAAHPHGSGHAYLPDSAMALIAEYQRVPLRAGAGTAGIDLGGDAASERVAGDDTAGSGAPAGADTAGSHTDLPGFGSAPGFESGPGLGSAPGLDSGHGLDSAPGLDSAAGPASAPPAGSAAGTSSAPGLSAEPGRGSSAGGRASDGAPPRWPRLRHLLRLRRAHAPDRPAGPLRPGAGPHPDDGVWPDGPGGFAGPRRPGDGELPGEGPWLDSPDWLAGPRRLGVGELPGDGEWLDRPGGFAGAPGGSAGPNPGGGVWPGGRDRPGGTPGGPYPGGARSGGGPRPATPGRSSAAARWAVGAVAAVVLVGAGTGLGMALRGSAAQASGNAGGQVAAPPCPTEAPDTTPQLCVAQPTGDGATVFVIHGSGYAPGLAVTVSLAGVGTSPDRPVTDQQGTFNYAIDQGHRFFRGPIPPGTYTAVATAPGERSVRVTFTVHPPGTGPPQGPPPAP